MKGSRDGKSQRREEKKKGYQKRESLRRKKIGVREKVGKSRNIVFYQWFVAPEEVGSLKRRVRSQLARWAMKNCTPLWREAHFEVKMYKAHQVRTTFGSWNVEKVHAVVARSAFRSQNVQKHQLRATFGSWDVEKVHDVVARSTFRSQMYKKHQLRTTFGSWDVEKVHAFVARSQNVKSTRGSDHFWTFRLDVQMWFRVAFPKTIAVVGHLKRICKDAFSVQAQYKRHVHQRC